jgi:hypothetical protein
MSRHARAALAAAVVVAAFTLAPAAAAERATLKVTARVVDRCTIEVPVRVPPGLWRDGEEPWHLVRHACKGASPLRVRAERLPLAHLHDAILAAVRQGAARVHEVRHPTRADVVLITITY